MSNNILQALLNREAAERTVALAVQDDEQAEFRRIVDSIHAAYAPYAAQVQTLILSGDYGRPVVFGEREKHLTQVETAMGLAFALGSRISPEALKLTVTARKAGAPASIEMQLERKYPFTSESLDTFSAKTAPEHLVQAMFETLVKYLHPTAFASQEKAAEA